MIKKSAFLKSITFVLLLAITSICAVGQSNENTTKVDIDTRYQKVTGFGAALAYYENWLNAHPNKSDIYEAIFSELSLDILRVRNSYGYDNEMVQRVREYVNEAEKSLGHPIELLSTSWGPPAHLKSNNDRNNGGTIRYTVTEDGVEFDYEAFADWWVKSVGQYNAYGVYPTYISIQNEPDWTADYESCRFDPTETITEEDTIAGYDKALEAVYNKIQELDRAPKLVGPETIGIGYNAVERFVNALNTDYIYAIAHHLYHGIKDESNPWTSTDFSKVGKYKPEIPHFQTEFSRSTVDWFNTAALIYKSFNDEGVTAYLYWDLIWDGGGLVSLDFPWDKDRWDDPQKGYTKTKQFYSFKQFSAFIHPGWQRVDISADNSDLETLAFTNPDSDTISVVLINRNNSEAVSTSLAIEGFNIDTSAVYVTTEEQNCEHTGT
ncbi:MAG: hypothetical protein PF486_05395, partial [Prolixibacteraceae bacterium]|nr:hypothetical protein [Prolixibacteraceae bacterium]